MGSMVGLCRARSDIRSRKAPSERALQRERQRKINLKRERERERERKKKKDRKKESRANARVRSCAMDGAFALQKGALRARSEHDKFKEPKLFFAPSITQRIATKKSGKIYIVKYFRLPNILFAISQFYINGFRHY